MSDSEVSEILERLKFDSNGLIPAIVQDHANGRVLMMAWMNATSLERSIESGYTHFWSRSRKKYWKKGESSGHLQAIRRIELDCDGDTLLIQVEQKGAACHQGYRSCFFRALTLEGRVVATEERLRDPEEIYGSSGKDAA